MASRSRNARRAFWRADWFVAVLAVVAVVALNRGTDFFGALERRAYDYGSTAVAVAPSPRVAVVAIDNESIARIGRWPWSRDVHAALIDKLAAGGAKTIAHTALFLEPQADRGLAYIQRIKQLLPATDRDAVSEQVAQVVAQAESALDTDARLADSMRRAGTVLLPSVYSIGAPLGRPDAPLPDYIARSTVGVLPQGLLAADGVQHPIAVLGSATAGVGHLNQFVDPYDGQVRQEPLVLDYFGRGVPSMALLAAAHSLNLGVPDIEVRSEVVRLGRLRIGTDAEGRMLPKFYRPATGTEAFSIDSFHDVLEGKVPASKFAGKVVLIGATADGVGNKFGTPVAADTAPVQLIAHVTSSILGEHFMTRPTWALYVEKLALLAAVAFLILVLPRLSAGVGAALSAALFLALLGTELGLLMGSAQWVQLVLPAALLVLGYLAVTTKRFLVTEAGKLKSDEESAETNRMMGLALQGQGQLDMAFDRFRRVPLNTDVMDNLYNLALDFERKRQFNKAQAVYEHMAAFDKDYKDLPAKMNRAKNLSETVLLGGGGSHPGGTLVLDNGAVEKPMLGRYQVEKELGKGAMGVVYQGRDPKIGRVVAIKTMALGQEFEGDALADARERFFREAETAGRLQHQHIVTIFDAGEEHDLAYIAMEFLKGRDLTAYCRGDNLLPLASVVSIVERVAEALDYAHQQHVVHRDIKPANIMWHAESDTVKVTDFGIARITDSSRTKTGLVLGTPSFMSPEQLAGRKVDGRSDLYSLGVMLYQLLGGVLPFRGESMAELMYKIANDEAPDIRVVRREVPDALAEVVATALRKQPAERYHDGRAFAAALRAAWATSNGRPPAAPPATGFDDTVIPNDAELTPYERTLVQGPGAHGGRG